ncbi:hypothetical protein BKA67DRAFT_660199 [Truncatella angustata]|uniref:Uncharacterized protein n=1 Tax=Truncatella angustata TaxID=152316 RepID=A0A9P8UK74_9PEZI|nr:uncharacterized protein BKA67DRAFT_660199 [Truncatella angustata]KAH6653632.1 hypothetical protein BKA67DRAFT_660199 [Truncatella angustata]
MAFLDSGPVPRDGYDDRAPCVGKFPHCGDRETYGPEPDGDTVKFLPDNPAWVQGLPWVSGVPPKINSRGISVRLEAIDALETHYQDKHGKNKLQELHLANAARDELLSQLGFTNVKFLDNSPNKVASANHDSLPGYWPGADGSTLTVDEAVVDRSVNAKLLANGLAYPAFYGTLPAALREHLATKSGAARTAQRGLWPRSTADKETAAEEVSPTNLQSFVIWPKLFRRVVEYFADGNDDFDNFNAWLLRDARRADEAERERRDEKRRADEAEKRQEEAELLTRRTTLDEYIAATHDLVASHFAVETDKELTSKGPITNPLNKLCLKNLRPWPDFLEQQRTTLGALYGTFPVSDRRFEYRGFLTSLGQRIAKRPISCEKTLEYFLHNSVEDPVREIFDQLRDVDQVRHDDVAEEVVDRQASSIPPQTPDQGKHPGRIRPNQSCVYQFDDELSTRRTMLYVSKYKAPHKLTAPYLRVGLHPMDIFKDVTGENPAHSCTHLAEPAFEVAAQSGEHHACTAVGQYLAFSLMALGPPGNPPNVRSQDERQRVILGLRRWAEDFETTLRSIPRDERYAPSSSSSGSLYAPTTYAGISRSPRVPRTRPKRWAQEEDCPDVQPRFRDRDDESSSDESLPPMPDTPTQ